MNGLQVSRWLAFAGGVLAPLGDTVRRWGTWREYPPNLFDDYLMGALLLYGAWRAGRDAARGRAFLAAAWGLACGFGYYSFFGQWRSMSLGEPDPAGIPSAWVLAVKGFAWCLAVVALALTLRHRTEDERRPR